MKARKFVCALVYIVYAMMSVAFFFFFLMSISESETSAIIGISFFLGCIALCNLSKLANVIFKAYARITMQIASKLESLLISK